MRILILFALLTASARALPTPNRALTRDELDDKANDVEAFLLLLDQIKRIALIPRDEADWEQPDSNVRDIEAFLATIDFLNNPAVDIEWESDSLESNTEELLDILYHLRSWVLATGGDMKYLYIQEHEKDDYTAVLSLIEDVENYISDTARNNEEFVNALDWLRSITLATDGDWERSFSRRIQYSSD